MLSFYQTVLSFFQIQLHRITSIKKGCDFSIHTTIASPVLYTPACFMTQSEDFIMHLVFPVYKKRQATEDYFFFKLEVMFILSSTLTRPLYLIVNLGKNANKYLQPETYPHISLRSNCLFSAKISCPSAEIMRQYGVLLYVLMHWQKFQMSK